MRIRSTAQSRPVIAALLMLGSLRVAVATPAPDPFELVNSIPAPPASATAAGTASQVRSDPHGPLLVATACEALKNRITDAMKAAGTAAGIDLGGARSDPAYAAQLQTRMQAMSMADKMAMANQIMAAQRAGAGAAASTGVIAAFIGGQRTADGVAQQKIRSLLDGALGSAGARHRAVDDDLKAAVKTCPTDKTGWPLESCTGPLGTRSIAQHRAVEDAALGSEAQALTQARTLALAELNKGRTLLTQARGTASSSLTAWALAYVQVLNDYDQAITLRAGFWAHADSSKFTGSVTNYIKAPTGEIYWPLRDPSYGPSIGVGL